MWTHRTAQRISGAQTCAIIALLCAMLVLVAGCVPEDLQATSRQANAAMAQLQDRLDELEPLRDEWEAKIAELDAKLAEAGVSEEDREEFERQLAEARAKLEEVDPTITGIRSEIDRLAEIIEQTDAAIQAAQDPWDMAVAIIEGGGTAVAPFAGPYAGWILLASSIAGPIIGAIRGKRRGVRDVAQPIQQARDAGLEAELKGRNGNGEEYLVVRKARAAAGHQRKRVDRLIDEATS